MTSSKEITSLRTLPIELRNIIYHLLLRGTWDGVNGQLQVRKVLTALKADPGLYKEALAIFYETNTFCLTYRNNWLQQYFVQCNGVRFMDTCVVSLASTLQKVYVQVPLSTPDPGPINGKPSQTPTFDRTARIIRMAQNLTHLHIEPCINSSCRTQWLALVCDLIGPTDCCPALQKLEITWEVYLIDRYSVTVAWTIEQFNKVFGTAGRLEGAFTGNKSSWVWEHRRESKGKTLKWGNDKPHERIVVSFAEINSLSHKDNKVHFSDQVWFIQHGYPSGYRSRSLRALSAQNPDEVDIDLPTELNQEDEKGSMWKEISKNDFLAIKSRCEKEQKRGPLVHHETRNENHLTKWLHDQGFESAINATYNSSATNQWREHQLDCGNPSQRGGEGELDYIPREIDIEIDEFDTTSRVPSLDTHPTASRRLPKVVVVRGDLGVGGGKKYHSALPSDWSCGDSDEGGSCW
ncbi:hypothetical protein EAF04_000411 [Stromatinia cepivora]|nr:hypothetical protein EAF04_000411 [Stromatinia cepivora]